MKTLIFVALSLATLTTAQAASVKAARYNAQTQSIDVDVVYSGGCQEHSFTLQMHGCLESAPVQCTAQVIDLTKGDFCEAMVGKTVSFPLATYKLDNDYFSLATIRLLGDAKTSATISLPNRQPKNESGLE